MGPSSPSLYNRTTPQSPRFPSSISGWGPGTPKTFAPSSDSASYFPSTVYEDRKLPSIYDGGQKEAHSQHPLPRSSGLGSPGTDLIEPKSFLDSEAFWLGIYFLFNVRLASMHENASGRTRPMS